MATPRRRKMSAGIEAAWDLADGLRPEVNRVRIVKQLDDLFAAGSVPDPPPTAFIPGRLLATTTWAPWDAAVRRMADLWMPWMGKAFDPASQTGVNHFTRGAGYPMRILWPSYRPERAVGDRLEAFPFRTWVGSGALDAETEVLKIDYDSDPNPKLLIRRVLDELVQVGKGQYLGKVLLWWKGAFHRVGFFSLGGERK